MTLKENPFYILGVSPIDNKRKIMDAAEEKLLFMDADVVENAKNDLLDSNRRLDAELGWFLTFSYKLNDYIINDLDALVLDSTLTPLIYEFDEVNYELELLKYRLKYFKQFSKKIFNNVFVLSVLNIAKNFEEYAKCDEYSSIYDLEELINEIRQSAGFPAINTEDLLEHLDVRREDIATQLKEIMNELPSDCLMNAITSIVEKSTAKASERAPMLIELIMESYIVEVQQFMDNQTKKIHFFCNLIFNENIDKQKKDLQIWTDKLIVYIVVWNKIIKPIQIFSLSKGKEHNESSQILGNIRDVCLNINNEFGMPKLSLKILKKLRDENVFEYIPSFNKLVKEDIEILTPILRKQEEYERQQEEEEKIYDNWCKTIFYETKINSNKAFKISVDEGIYWNGVNTPLSSITGVSWGGIKHSATDISYKIAYKSERGTVEIYPDEHNYKVITNRLWIALLMPMYMMIMTSMKNGETLTIGKIKFNDYGVYLIKQGWIWNDEKFFNWNDSLTAYTENGLFVIAEKNGKFKAEASYMDDMNTHFLDHIIHKFFENIDPYNPRISSISGK